MSEQPRSRVLAFMEDPQAGRFEPLALEAFRHQWRYNTAYRNLCDARGVNPGGVSDWRGIPAVSTVAFKRLTLCTGAPAIVFRTSGTTRSRERRGAHHMVDTDLYRAALRRQFRRFVLPDRARIRLLILVPSPEQAPDSSLGFMLADVLEQFGEPGSAFCLGPRDLDHERLIRCLEAAVDEETPVALAGTTLAMVHLLDKLARDGLRFPLPAGSRIMDTGGFKGLTREIGRADFLAACHDRLAVPPSQVVNEYGMTEMSSQFYDASLHGGDPEVKIGPHWVRTQVIDPETGLEAPPGRPGLLRHVDLANLDSVVAVETEDLGHVRGEGFVLLGRSAGAEPRGCSIATDELLGRGR